MSPLTNPGPAQLLLEANADVWMRDGAGQTVIAAAKARAGTLPDDGTTGVFQLLGHHARAIRVYGARFSPWILLC
jgi:hypothetical protein